MDRYRQTISTVKFQDIFVDAKRNPPLTLLSSLPLVPRNTNYFVYVCAYSGQFVHVESYNIRSSLSSFTWHVFNISIIVCVGTLWVNNVPLYGYSTLSLSIDGHLGGFDFS